MKYFFNFKIRNMKKIYFLFLFIPLSLFSTLAMSQSFSLSNISGPVANGSVISVHGLNDAALIEAPVYVTNNSLTDTLWLKVRKFIVDTLPGTTNTFCFGLCYGATVYNSPSPLVIPPNTTLYGNAFNGEYTPYGHDGTTTVRYRVYNVNNSDTSSFTVNYSASANGIDENQSNWVSLHAYPNPANATVAIEFQLKDGRNNANLQIQNILGEVVKGVSLQESNGKRTIQVADLSNGVYFYTLKVDNHTLYSKKLIIRH